jgi:hypothetical protein
MTTTRTPARVKPGSLKLASAQELQQRALSSLSERKSAASNPKSKQAKQTAVAKALEFVQSTHPRIYNLSELGRTLPDSPVEYLLVEELVSAVSDQVRESICEALDILAGKRHPAIQCLRRAADAIDCAERIAIAGGECGDGGTTKAPRLFAVAIGGAIASYSQEAGRWLGQAEEALGSDGRIDWLNHLDYIPGLPIGEYRRLDVQEQWFYREFHGMTQEQRSRVAELVAAVNQAGAK